jgi:hypothetical protein
MDIVSVYKQLDGKDMLIYLSESNELFSSQRYQGYLRNTETSYFFDPKMISRQMERNTYKLVLLFSKTTCDKDVRNTIANLLMDVPQSGIVSIKPLKSYPDSWDNIKKELNKDSAYINYRVVVVDIETEEIICKNKIVCREPVVENNPIMDNDALLFINAAQITNENQKEAVNTLVINLKNYNLWNKMTALYPFVGGNSNSHKWNLKDPRDLDAAFRLQFNGGLEHSDRGIKPNGINGWANTFLVPSSVLTQNSTHLSYYSRTQDNNGSGAEITSSVSNNSYDMIALIIRLGGMFECDLYNALTSQISTTTNNSKGFYVGTRTNANTVKAFKNNIQIGNTMTGNPGDLSLVNGNIELFRYSTFGYSTKECAFISIGQGLTDLESENLYTIVNAYELKLRRKA